MKSTGRRIAVLAASLIFTASTAGLLYCAVAAQELPGTNSPEPPADSQSASLDGPSESDGSDPSAEGTDPANPQTSSETDPSKPEISQTEPLATGSDPIGSTDPADSSESGDSTDPTESDPPVTQSSADPAVTTPSTQAQTASGSQTTKAKATKAPSHDPVLSWNAATSQEPIPLSTDGDASATVFVSGEQPGPMPGNPENPGNPGISDPSGNGPEEGNTSAQPDQGAKIRGVTVFCSLLTALSGGLLVLLKFIH